VCARVAVKLLAGDVGHPHVEHDEIVPPLVEPVERRASCWASTVVGGTSAAKSARR
jgi:hypothetical protein